MTPRRYVLVQRNGGPRAEGAPVRRFSLARVPVSRPGVARRSALGVDRHERLERIAERDRS
jgi:hypothetical protein